MTDIAPALAATRDLAAALAVPARKSADGEVDAYAALLSGYVDDGLSGAMDRVDLARAHRALLREYGPAVYVASLEDCGVPEEDMTQEDEDAISGWVSDQLGYAPDFAAAVIAARGDDLAAEAVRGRVDTWAASARALATVACMSAKRDVMGNWRLGPTREHCQDHGNTRGCEQLAGQRHRLSWWKKHGLIPQEPGSTTLTCGAWECKCHIDDDEGNQLIP